MRNNSETVGNDVFYAVRADMLEGEQVEQEFRVVRESVQRILIRCSWELAVNEIVAEAEDTPLLETVTRKQLMKTQETEKT
jgi:hypothetical protein